MNNEMCEDIMRAILVIITGLGTLGCTVFIVGCLIEYYVNLIDRLKRRKRRNEEDN